MDGVWPALITGVCALAAGIVGSYFLFRGKKVEQETEETKAEASATDAFLKGQTAFQEYVDKVVEKRVEAAVAGFQQRLAEVEAKLHETEEMHEVIRTRETQLWIWNFRSRPGPMPELPEPIREKLGIGHLSQLGDLEDTQPTRPMPEPPTT